MMYISPTLEKERMFRIIRAFVIVVLMIGANPPGFSQLRHISPYGQDRINADQTYFVLKDANTAGFAWAAEWTQGTALDYAEKHPFFVWYFKDGSKAYSRFGIDFGDVGISLDYLLYKESGNLEDPKQNKTQPMTRTNFPVKVELWIGEEENGFKPETRVDAACFDAQSIEYGRVYHFSVCK
jgi:hypothetical protein